MNVDTLTLIRRSYPDLVDDLLTAVVGGVVNEPIPFDVAQDRYQLRSPAAAVRSVKGTAAGSDGVHVFLPNVDYAFSAVDSTIAWLPKGAAPVDETTFYVDYFRPGASSPLTDVNVGSVTRTLTEAIGREIATVFQEINNAYLAGFVNTATGASLDQVVAILGVVRKDAEYATGLATFLRNPAVDGSITIADLTQVSTAKGVVFETEELRTLQRGQQRLDVPIRAIGAAKGPLGLIGPGELVRLQSPIAGVASVTNFDATVLGAAPETDDELRNRAKATLQGLGNATLAALARAVFDERSTLQEVRDPNSPPGHKSPNGTVSLLVSTEPARFESLNAAMQQTRAAGVLATVLARYVFVTPRIALTLAAPLTPAGKLKLADQAIAALRAYFDSVPAGEPALSEQMLAALAKVPAIKAAAPRFLDVLAARADIDDPGDGPLVDALVTAVLAAKTTDPAALATAITDVLTADVSAQPGERRTPDRSLIQGKNGPATDDEIEAGVFRVVPPAATGDQKWSVALDMTVADIQIIGG